MERVGFGSRLLATLIDFVLITVGTGVIALGLGLFSVDPADRPPHLVIVIVSVLQLAYFSLEVFKAATPGKMVLRFRIRKKDGGDADKGVLIRRFGIKYSGYILNALGFFLSHKYLYHLGGLVGVVLAIGCLLVLRPGRQALHDKLAGTAVFKE